MKEKKVSKVIFLEDLGLNAHVHYMYLVQCTAGETTCRGIYSLKRNVFVKHRPYSCRDCYLESMRKERRKKEAVENDLNKIVKWV